RTIAISILLAGIMGGTEAQTAPQGPVILPQGPPPTGPQGAVPLSAQPLPDPLRPILESPGTDQLANLVVGHTLTIDDAVAIALATSRSYATAAANLEASRGRT